MNDNLVISFRSAGLETQILERGEQAGVTARRDVERYYVLLATALRQVKLTSAEAKLICDALNGTLNNFQINPQQSLAFSIADAIEYDHLDQKWGVDTAALKQKLESLNILQAAAVLDAVERFWFEPGGYHLPDIDQKLRIVGLVR